MSPATKSNPEPTEDEALATDSDAWDQPTVLLDQLDDLAGECETGCWAMAVAREVDKLGKAMAKDSDEFVSLLGNLQRMRQEADRLAAQLRDDLLAGRLRRAGYALERRTDLWRQMVLAGGFHSTDHEKAASDPHRLPLCLNEVDAITRATPEGRLWQEYLTLDALRETASEPGKRDPQKRRLIARSILERLTRTPMNERQRRYLDQQPLTTLKAELRRMATDPVEMTALLHQVEQYERTGVPSDARALAESRQRLAQDLETHYRNANIRLAVTDEFLNRFIPERAPEVGEVEDVILGRRVHGQSVVAANVAVRLIPDPQKLRMALEVNGAVSSLTHSTAGPATFYNDGQAYYRAWKEIELGPEGMQLRPAEVDVNNNVWLRSLSTDFDGIPLIGSIVQSVARNQHESQRWQASQEMRAKIYARAQQQVDREADARLSNLTQRLQDRVLRPVSDLSLGPTVVSAETTQRRCVLRLRLAAEDQLGASTPRPMAPGDCLGSLQVHESALNNLLERLQLDGQTFTLPQLRQHLATRLNRPELIQRETENDDITIAFAPQNAAQVRCHNGQVAITLAIARLTKGGQSWEDFEVRAFYRPQTSGPNAELVRDEVVHLLGERLNTRGQIVLRGIFSKAFSKQKPIAVLPDRVAKDPRMAGLRVTQVVLDDGWLGVALGPDRSAQPVVARLHDGR